MMKDIITNKKYRMPLLLIGAVLMGFTLTTAGKLGFLQWLAFVPSIIALTAIADDEKIKMIGVYGRGFLFYMALYVIVYHWFWSMYPLDFTGLSPLYALCVILLANFGLPIFAALPGGFVFVAFTLARRSKRFELHKWIPYAVLAFAYAVFEWTQTLFFTGVPWGRLSIGQVENSLILCSVSFFGSYFLSFIIVLVNAFIAYAIIHKRKLGYAAAASSFAFVLILGTVGNLLTYTGGIRTVKAAAIQGNMASQEKWSADGMQIAADIYTRITDEAVAEGAQIVVWPESVFPASVENKVAVRCVTSLTSKYDIELFYGTLVYDDRDNYNAMVHASGGEITFDNMYYKRHLVPFGEYVPYRDFIRVVFPMLDQVSMLNSDTTAGTDSALFNTKYGKVGSLICFDTIYEDVSLDAVRDGAELIVIGTNDSWFFDSAAVYMHNAQARIRACETGRYVIRSANTGVSSIINARGELIDMEDALLEGYVVGDIEMRNSRTLYSIVGNAVVVLSGIVCAYVLVVYVYDKVKKNR
jgi:apolipoprotein N-acyltransferase